MSKNLNLELPTVDDLFTTQADRDEAKLERVKNIPIAEICEFPNHPYRVELDDAMNELVDSVKAHGLLHSVLVRPKADGGFEMVAGHRRMKAYEIAGITEIPCIIREMTDDEAILAMVDSNLQRERIRPSEKAFAYKMRLEALKRQGQRSDLTSAPMEPKLRSNDELSKAVSESVAQIKRYVRLTELSPPLLDLVDSGKIAFRPAVELSYLPPEQQELVNVTIESEDCTPSLAQAIKMKKFGAEGRLNEDVILSIMTEEKPNQKEVFKLPKEKITRFFPDGATQAEMEEKIIKALEMYVRRKSLDRGER